MLMVSKEAPRMGCRNVYTGKSKFLVIDVSMCVHCREGEAYNFQCCKPIVKCGGRFVLVCYKSFDVVKKYPRVLSNTTSRMIKYLKFQKEGGHT